jgi:peptide/nickel transport system substrate-binding protein
LGRRGAIAALLFGVTLTLAIACAPQTNAPEGSGSPDAAASGDPDQIRLLYWQAPTILNPHLASGFKDFDAARVTYEPLATYDKNGDLIPFLAAEAPSLDNGGVAEDGKSVTWTLKSGIKWSDGQPFTARDVVFTYEYLSNPEVAASTTTDYAAVETVEAIDDTTVKITFKDVTPAWSQPFVGLNGMILPEHIFQDFNGSNAQEAPANLKPVGTGPYRVVEFKPGDIVLYEANPEFRDPVPFQRVEIKGGGDATSAARAVLQTGDADYAYNPQVEAAVLDQLLTGGKGELTSVFGPQTERIHFNFTDPNQATADGERSSREFPHPFFSDLKVRQAFALAVDRDTISEQLYGPTGRPTANMIVSPEPFNSPNTSYEFNLDRAKALLDEAGWTDTNGDGIRDKDGVDMQVVFATSVNPLRQKTQEIVKQAWTELGVGVELKTVDAGVFFSGDPANPDTINRFETDLQMYTTGNSSPDPGAHLKWWTCDEVASKANDWNLNNYTRYCKPEFDALWEQSTTILDPAEREAAMIAMNDVLINDAAVIPLVNRAEVGAVSKALVGVDLTPWDSDTWNIKDWKRP